jgi:hypothetical protein
MFLYYTLWAGLYFSKRYIGVSMNVTLFGNRVFSDVIKLKELTEGT